MPSLGILPHIQTKGLTAEIILNSFDVVLAKIGSGLYFDKDDLGITDVADPVKIADFDVDGISWYMV